MPGPISQIHQAPFGQQNEVIIAGFVTINRMYLRFYFFPFPVLSHEGSIDFIVEVTDIANDRPGF